jgi:hypothetical protein
MARIPTILKALGTAVRRDGKSLSSFTANNLFLLGVTFLALKDPQAFAFFSALIAMALFLPMSADPLRKIPRDRLALWPLSNAERRWLRIISPWLNPLMWVVMAGALWKGITRGLWAVIAGAFAFGFLLPSTHGSHKKPFRYAPHFPGPLNQLIRKNLRELVSTLDFYVALLFAAGSAVSRAMGLLPPEALNPLTVLVMIAFSTPALSLFGLEGEGGMARYRLLPIRGWQALAAKDAAYALIATVLTAALNPVAGLAVTLTALAVGHHASVKLRREETRWRFTTGVSFGSSLFQMVAMGLTAAAAGYAGAWALIPCVGVWGWSTARFGRELERP